MDRSCRTKKWRTTVYSGGGKTNYVSTYILSILHSNVVNIFSIWILFFRERFKRADHPFVTNHHGKFVKGTIENPNRVDDSDFFMYAARNVSNKQKQLMKHHNNVMMGKSIQNYKNKLVKRVIESYIEFLKDIADRGADRGDDTVKNAIGKLMQCNYTKVEYRNYSIAIYTIVHFFTELHLSSFSYRKLLGEQQRRM